jgi:hypothetical protein
VRVGGAVDVVDPRPERRQAARDERLAQALGGEREVRGHAQAAEALAEHAPTVHAQRVAQRLGVADDRVGAEVRQPIDLLVHAQAR